MTLEFEWDSQKAAANRKKHGISFEAATNVFYDKHRIEIFDITHSMEEDRYITIGLYNDILFVVYTERHPKIRIISARLATARERKLYYDSNI